MTTFEMHLNLYEIQNTFYKFYLINSLLLLCTFHKLSLNPLHIE